MFCPILRSCQNAPPGYEAQITALLAGRDRPPGLEIRVRFREYGTGYSNIVDTMPTPDGPDNRPYVGGLAAVIGPTAHPVVWDEFSSSYLPPAATSVSNISSYDAYHRVIPASGTLPSSYQGKDVSFSVRRVGLTIEPDADDAALLGAWPEGMLTAFGSQHYRSTLVFGVAHYSPIGDAYDSLAQGFPDDPIRWGVTSDEVFDLDVPTDPGQWSAWSPWLQASGQDVQVRASPGDMFPYTIRISRVARLVLKHGPYTQMSLQQIYSW